MTRIVAFFGIFGLGVLTAQAQQHYEDPEDGGVIHQIMMTPFVLPMLQTELGLSAQQVTQLRQWKQEMLGKAKELSGQIASKREELDGLLTVGTSKGELVKRLYEEIGSLRGQQQFVAYDTAIKMKAELTEAQRAKLAGLNPHELHQAMMSRMSMNDRMEMMPFVAGDGMMDGHMAMHEGMMGAAK